MLTVRILALALPLTVAGGLHVVHQEPDLAAHLIRFLDGDGDGKVDPGEAAAPMVRHFEQVDANSDGFVDEAERTALKSLLGCPFHSRLVDGLAELLDRDEDGKISRAELERPIGLHFRALDRDGNGSLDAPELKGLHRHMGNHAFKFLARTFKAELDLDRDGKISLAEVLRPAGAHFDEVDSNGDGLLDEPELRQVAEFLSSRLAHGNFWQRHLGHLHGQVDPGRHVVQFVRAHLDADGDGSLSRAEALAPVRTHFEALDTGGDGYLEGEELRW